MPWSREVWRLIRHACQQATVASIASSRRWGPTSASRLSDVVGEVAAVPGVEEVAHAFGRGFGRGGDHRARRVPALHRVGAAVLHGAEEAPVFVRARQGDGRHRWVLPIPHMRRSAAEPSDKRITSLLSARPGNQGPFAPPEDPRRRRAAVLASENERHCLTPYPSAVAPRLSSRQPTPGELRGTAWAR